MLKSVGQVAHHPGEKGFSETQGVRFLKYNCALNCVKRRRKSQQKNQDYFSSLHCPESIVEDPKEYRSSRMAFAETGISSVPVGPTRLLKEQFV